MRDGSAEICATLSGTAVVMRLQGWKRGRTAMAALHPTAIKEDIMAKAKKKSLPNGIRSVTPHLVCDGAADAIAFYKKAFGAVEMMRLPGPGWEAHACLHQDRGFRHLPGR
jgi:hypothetical protein